MLLSNCAVCDYKKSKFLKGQEARELSSSIGLKTSLNQIILFGIILF